MAPSQQTDDEAIADQFRDYASEVSQ